MVSFLLTFQKIFKNLCRMPKRRVSGGSAMHRVASVVVRAGNRVLLGKRRDTGRWTLPSGHADVDESMPEAAVRELWEEAGLRVSLEMLTFLGREKRRNRSGEWMEAFVFEVELAEEASTTTAHDPDEEVSEWAWFETLPELQNEAMRAWI
jgi:8-oxo-dGTP pyrophosphatase MutT (NUDIX family)